MYITTEKKNLRVCLVRPNLPIVDHDTKKKYLVYEVISLLCMYLLQILASFNNIEVRGKMEHFFIRYHITDLLTFVKKGCPSISIISTIQSAVVILLKTCILEALFVPFFMKIIRDLHNVPLALIHDGIEILRIKADKYKAGNSSKVETKRRVSEK